jgi:peptidoglycan/LPS O-acetylase OafA/YrhL
MSDRKENHLQWIDALRGFAALWVIVFHSRATLWVGLQEIRRMPGDYLEFDRLAAWLSLPTIFGGSAVMLFFLISGFCIHLPYAASDRAFGFKQYAIRRGLRIIPPYLFAVMLTWLLEWLAFWMGGNPPTGALQMFRVATLTQNYGPGQPLTNPSLWSLPVEVELYVAYVAIYFLLKSIKISLTAIIVSTGSLIATIFYLHGGYWGGNFLHFWAIWCAGALLAEWWKRDSLPKFQWLNGAILLLFTLVALAGTTRQWPYGVLHYLWAAVFFHLLWLALLYPKSFLTLPKWCGNLFVWMGTVSYSAYLIHYPVFAFTGYLWQRVYGGKPANFLVPLLFSILIWPVAWLFWKFGENPFHQLAQRLHKRAPLTPLISPVT